MSLSPEAAQAMWITGAVAFVGSKIFQAIRPYAWQKKRGRAASLNKLDFYVIPEAAVSAQFKPGLKTGLVYQIDF